MKITVCKNPSQLGETAAAFVAAALKDCIQKNGSARIALSTGASQLDTINALVKTDVDWSKVEMFHLDEYIDLEETHKASFRKYLKERFIYKTNLKKAYLVDGTVEGIAALTEEIRRKPIDIGLIGIGENAHIAFNDPPADFDTKEAYIAVNLNETCKRQQVGEGWFKNVDEVPRQAVSMTVYQILQCRTIVSCVPNAVKAQAIKDTLYNAVTNRIPATILKEHKDFNLYIEQASASLVEQDKINTCGHDAELSYTVL